jgi:hypothetical protein
MKKKRRERRLKGRAGQWCFILQPQWSVRRLIAILPSGEKLPGGRSRALILFL